MKRTIRFSVAVPVIGEDTVDVRGLVQALALLAAVDSTRAAVRGAGGDLDDELVLVAGAVDVGFGVGEVLS